jgi:hypothetical protein
MDSSETLHMSPTLHAGPDDGGSPENQPEPQPEAPVFENEREHARIENWAEMRALIKANLGAPLICVELSLDQLNNAIQDAIDFLHEYWSYGSYKDIITLQLVKNQREYLIEEEGILAAIEIVSATANSYDDYDDRRPFTLERQIARAVPTPSSHPPLNSRLGLTDIETMMQGLRDWQFRYVIPFAPKWNDLSKTLIVEPTPQQDCKAGLVIWRREKMANLFNTLQFRRLATAYAGIRWASNLSKYTISLPGGASMNAQTMKSDWVAERDKWEAQIRGERASIFSVG